MRRSGQTTHSPLFFFLIALLLTGCATSFPRPDRACCEGASGDALFARTYAAHGGVNLRKLTDLNVALDGQWKFLITRIQPLVTDHRYRVRSEERIDPHAGVYAALYQGPAGTKQVFRSRDTVRVWYNGEPSTDADVLASTALTADSFLLFSLGPLSPIASGNANDARGSVYRRLPDAREDGTRYHRIYRTLRPGLGNSEADELVLWIDAETMLTYRVHITLEGFRTTIGAHVDVTFLDYTQREGLLIPVAFNERVRGPIAIEAHEWRLTGLDLNRGWAHDTLSTSPWSGTAAHAATLFPQR